MYHVHNTRLWTLFISSPAHFIASYPVSLHTDINIIIRLVPKSRRRSYPLKFAEQNLECVTFRWEHENRSFHTYTNVKEE
jgi:hypothetical protein